MLNSLSTPREQSATASTIAWVVLLNAPGSCARHHVYRHTYNDQGEVWRRPTSLEKLSLMFPYCLRSSARRLKTTARYFRGLAQSRKSNVRITYISFDNDDEMGARHCVRRDFTLPQYKSTTGWSPLHNMIPLLGHKVLCELKRPKNV